MDPTDSVPCAILFIEDDPDDIFLFQHALERSPMPCDIHVVSNVSDAQAYLSGTGTYADRERFPVPKLIITDLGFRGSSGLDFLQWLRYESGLGSIPVFCVSGTDHPAKLQQARSFGAICIRKSGECKELLDMIRQVVLA